MGRIVILHITLFVYQLLIIIDAKSTYLESMCDIKSLRYSKGSEFDKNKKELLDNLSSKSSSLMFYNDTVGDDVPNKVYGIFQCRYDVSLKSCSACIKDATPKIIEECSSNGEGIVWYDECMLRYANRNIFSMSDSSVIVSINDPAGDEVLDYEIFAPIFEVTMKDLFNNASSATPHFVASETELSWLDEKMYSFAQCTPDIDAFGCRECLNSSLIFFHDYTTSASASKKTLLPSCQWWYDTTGPILNDMPIFSAPPPPPAIIQGINSPPPPPPKAPTTSTKTKNVGAIAAVAVCVSVVLLGLCVVFCMCILCKNPKKSSTDVPPSTVLLRGTVKSDADGLGDTEFVQYDFKSLKAATNDFSNENMLGEGGFGTVYKGMLVKGEELAIKRLSGGHSGQGTKEFMTEARLLAKLQHRNLVRLVGFCSEGDEKLLVYEFMPNSSLDRFLFDPTMQHLLDWASRKTIIVGIARGLQYLHEDSRLTIIHRDLKPGNILLDKNMCPKIADFGLAKLFEDAQKFGNTARVAGTQGYMAPEYLMNGDYSDKSDVYSYGIMLLEIISGQKNRMSRQTPPREDLSIQTWKLWNEERSFEITDPVLLNNCSRDEVMRNIQIGLLCVQPNAEERPTMTAVVLMLTCSVDIPFPSAPIMSPNQFNMPLNYSVSQQSNNVDRTSTKTVTMSAEVTHDLHPKPR